MSSEASSGSFIDAVVSVRGVRVFLCAGRGRPRLRALSDRVASFGGPTPAVQVCILHTPCGLLFQALCLKCCSFPVQVSL